jgi:hypothetical protein
MLDKDQRKEAMRELRRRAEADSRAATAGR